MSDERFRRQEKLVPQDLLAAAEVLIVGVGAIGLQVARTLAITGVGRLKLVDPDVVEAVNLGSQGWPESAVEDKAQNWKVHVAETVLRAYSAKVTIDAEPRSYDINRDGDSPVVFCCVDNMAVRKVVFESVKDHRGFFCDGRMSAEMLKVFTVSYAHPSGDRRFDEAQKAWETAAGHYEGSLFTDEEAHQDGCTSRSIFYSANVAASLMVAQYLHWLRGDLVLPQVNFNLRAMDLWHGA